MTPRFNPLSLFRHDDQDTARFPAGAAIFDVGQDAHCMYVVKSGRVSLHLGDHTVEIVEAGGIIGEMALIDDAKRSARAVAETDCELIQVAEKRFQFLIQQTPYFAQHIMRVLTARLRAMNDKLR